MVKRFLRHRSAPFIDDPGWPEPRPNPDFQFQLLARKAILLGINQTMMMVLATVIITALIGAGGLGLLAYRAAANPQKNFGLGSAGGLSIVLLAIMLDRLTQAWGTRSDNDRPA